ncbi:hypothetical protein [Bartonella krasnovii]|uniref:Putative genomic island protein n=1 Tax=Bartonella krasnovii TaxID=2267275 RepID=A0A5B9D346_9HYPH|nr:hypothetical protein [Bartonella krasnovii]QEE12749.1 putative genomic island protein [Bartonella krasnovii]UNF28865.1 hypothetical protein MNL13_06575 [Bartonella krasnovii]UNF35234.1 hypothetical protein MNL12_06555 [Bartonella krasnovii]UNF36862.1 hypothetical protein MNL11_07230 [Bartonella krasnovii]UNF38547.1 hypothetical protein MNL10_07415 [Bartonella krasnovii]
MARKQTELTEKEKEILQEIIMTYKSIKVMSRYTKWVIFIIFLLALDFSRIMDSLASIFTQESNIQL